MSRDPTLTLDESKLVIGPDGRMHYTFTVQDDNQKVRLASNCLGTAHFNQVMIERGDKATSYVAPVVVEGTGNPTGIFKNLKEISLELTDTKNSNLWSKIKLNNRGMLQTYFDTTIKNEILTTAQGIRETIYDTERGLKSEFLKTVQGQRIRLENLLEQKTAQLGLTVDGLRLDLNKANKQTASLQAGIDGLRQDYRDADRQLSANYQAGLNGLKAQLTNDKIGLQAKIQATAQGLSQEYDDKISRLSAKITTTSSGTTEAYESKLDGLRAEFTHSNQGMRVELESKISGLQSTQQATARQISQEISNREGAVSRVQQGLDSYQRRLQSAEGNYNSLRETVAGYERRISNQDNTISSNFTQLKSLINQSVTLGKIQSLLRQSGDSIMLAIKDKIPQSKMSGSDIISAINLNSRGVQIAGKNIALDGNTTVNGAFGAKLGEFIKLRADQIIGGTIDANKINVINLKASSIVGLDANFIKARISYAITDLLEGKVIKARNGAMTIDLQSGQINHYTNESAMRRIDSSTASQFIKMTKSGFISEIGNMQAAMTVIGSNSDGSENHENKTFGGIRIWNGKSSYQSTSFVELVGNRVAIYGNKNRSPWLFDSTTSGYAYLIPQNDRGIKHVIGRADRKIDQIHVGDIYVQGERVAMMLKDLALKIGYIGTGGWANRIG
ncbi:TPA: gp58-like family protein [Streptococcus pyogenes]|uniref:gp58-like family protein n=1 Tax=Streptococcus pyogenes TaxID=1314 RepID=UPI0010A110DF|nr:gp58-like family protein [Streptococcus pyogenes]VGT78408.1 phage protein [Streptococcus pyogenes]VGU67242.1 phage protein [Streptococcus pyogenes]HEP1912618.1 gp58-like family protein [Streptococcus pyogenes]HEP1936391.1 gp58-like family protein [Streptococcus pyogenes]HEQ8232098.1 gp58-like family protein [Streptococcus pyogenes]